MSNIKKLMMSAAGGAGPNVEELFNTYVYQGTEVAGTDIVNGIDLSTEGGMVWIKCRNTSLDHIVNDTERGANNHIKTNSNTDNNPASGYLTAFNTDGFELGTQSRVNNSNNTYAAWTFRKAPRFFDVVTWTGNGTSGRTISHNLEVTPAVIMVKCTTSAEAWSVYYGDNGRDLRLDQDFASSATNNWNSTSPTATEFTLGSNGEVNGNGQSYVAYLFANNNGDGGFGATGDQDIIKCGTYSSAGQISEEVDLGFEPQFVIIKNLDYGFGFEMYDNMRGIYSESDGTGSRYAEILKPNDSGNETNNSGYRMAFYPEGFRYSNGISGADMLYIAIRRGPMAVPDDADDVFDTGTLGAAGVFTNTGIVTDMYMHKALGTESWYLTDRVTGRTLQPNQTGSQFNSTNDLDYMNGFKQFQTNSSSSYWAWKRAPGFFDIVTYVGNGSHPQTINHGLGAVPEMIWHKCRTGYNSGDWHIYHKDVYSNGGSFTESAGDESFGGHYNNINSTPTATTIDVKNISYDSEASNYTNYRYIMYLFASVPGVSKVGSYTGNSSTQTINCGFTSGARFVMIKCSTAGNTDWMIFDTHRGIVAGNDPLLKINETTGQATNTDWIDPHNSGFTVNALGDVNSNGETYIFYAIA